MIPREVEAEILRLVFAEKWLPGTVASQLGVHRSVVSRVIRDAALPRPRSLRSSMISDYVPFILETLEKYPRLTAARLYVMCRERGYPGRPDHFRHLVARIRPRKKAEAYLRLRTLPGEQAQADWGHFGKVKVGEQGIRPLVGFVMVLSYSRRIFLRFYLGQYLECFLRGHVAAFTEWGAVPRVILYDNLKSAVLDRIGDAIRFNPELLLFAGHHRYEPRPVAIARGNEKGRVERAIRYIRDAFFAARRWRDLDDLNEQALAWCRTQALDRPWPEDTRKTVREAFEEERGRLLPLPEREYRTDEIREVKVGRTPYVRFDGNDYSVPHELVRQTLLLVASEKALRIFKGNEVIAEHRRTYDKRQQIEDPRHIRALVGEKRRARRHRATSRLQAAAPSSTEVLSRLAERGFNLGTVTRELVALLGTYGSERLERAMRKALEENTPHPQSIRYLLEREREEAGKPPLLPLDLRQEKARQIVVKPHEIARYDELGKAPEDGRDDDQDEEYDRREKGR